jgi:hypothetical protein
MKKILFTTLLLLVSAGFAADVLELHFFGSGTCGECNQIKQQIFRPLEAEHADSLRIVIFDTDIQSEGEKVFAYEEKYGVKHPAPQELFFPDTFMTGADDILAFSRARIEQYLADRTKWTAITIADSANSVKDNLQKRIDENFAFWSITGAGLADGINPCAIATMIFLISFLTLQKRKKTEVLIVGLSFTASVFITYTLLGIGAFHGITALKKYHFVSEIIKWLSVSLAAFVAIFSFADAIRFAITKNATQMTLQLPNPVKKRIHKVISSNIRGTSLIIGTVITGFLVTLLEAVCTGQVYLPTIILMTRVEGFETAGWLWLVYYNLLFVFPLFIVMVAAYFGLTWERLATLTQKNLTAMKIILGLVMAAIAVYLAIN